MGYLKDNGKFMTYEESKPWQEYIKTHGVIQFINLLKKHQNKTKPFKNLKWGHESEYHVLASNPEEKKIEPFSNTVELIEQYAEDPTDEQVTLTIEFGASMLQGKVALSLAVPTKPFESLHGSEVLKIQDALNREVTAIEKLLLKQKLTLVTTSVVPYFGAPFDRSRPANPKENFFSEQGFTVRGMAQNIRLRRGKNVFIGQKVWLDELTDPLAFPKDKEGEPFIHMDSQLYGMTGNSLQLTYQASCLSHCRYLHDMLLPLTPVFLALSANSGIMRGVISQTDSRFDIIRGSVDCRTDEQRDKSNPQYRVKPRYSGINHYISKHDYVQKCHTDTPQLSVNPAHLSLLQQAGVDDVLASHIAQLFVYDAVVVFPDKIEVNDFEFTNHFENLQSTNWHTLRFKPPPSMDSPIGWRVEFRSMDLQLTSYENAALSVVISMLVNVINHFNVDFILPISQIDENIETGQRLNAAVTGLYWTKLHRYKQLIPNSLQETDFLKSELEPASEVEHKYTKISISDILQGYSDPDGFSFPGYFPLIRKYMEDMSYEVEIADKIEEYMGFLQQRALGFNCTGAQWIRKFVRTHPSYKRDSLVTEDILYDLYHSEGIKQPWRGPVLQKVKEQGLETSVLSQNLQTQAKSSEPELK